MKNSIFILILTFFSYMNFADAADHTGSISKINLNSAVANRGICIQMSPLIPTTSQWACLYDETKHLYKEMTSTLLAAYTTRRQCRISWSTEIDSKGDIFLIECE